MSVTLKSRSKPGGSLRKRKSEAGENLGSLPPPSFPPSSPPLPSTLAGKRSYVTSHNFAPLLASLLRKRVSGVNTKYSCFRLSIAPEEKEGKLSKDSLRSKRFQSSYYAKPSPVLSFFFAVVPTFSTNSRGNACYAGYSKDYS